jgi:hypothetical protein
LIYKKLPHIVYNKDKLLNLANSLTYSKAYDAVGHDIPQEIHPSFDLTHPLIKEITVQFKKSPFYNSSFIRTAPHTKIAPHVDSGGFNGAERTVNILFPLDNYVSPLTIHVGNTDYTVDIDAPIAFPCSELHSYENATDGYRTAFILQCKNPFDMRRLEWMGVI